MFLGAVTLAHRAELEMHSAVHALADEHTSESSVHDGHVGLRGVQGMADRVSHEESVAPVVSAVLEQVGQRHGAVRELVDEEGLKEALGVVESPRRDGQPVSEDTSEQQHCLLAVHFGTLAVDEGGSHEQQQHDGKRTNILVEKHLQRYCWEMDTHRSIPDLRTHITQNDVRVQRNMVIGESLSIVNKSQRLLLLGNCFHSLAYAREMTYA